MAQAYPYAQQSNRGTLVAGQTISVNKYTVQVERYLSQGGFAHVYLVRTAQPVYGTTHHVLKRIAVPNEAMLTEVKKEVDIMRILKGHPNIVHLIDAAWHRMNNSTFEVFILMEYCPGGGIIDMMNRRLRERLTEPEILAIFVDVCEGLAAMHALKPPLLHRDLKVENILQSSPSSYKLCDFGSATPVQRVPNNMAELRVLEADLNKHTTLQYRAPEMVDVFLRRPIDEKSDVWALGVLLYKLCYYTTPFEEHGPLAILNVQYKIPPYPVYSQNMNNLIGSMLREHGAQRPTVFEILNHVHTLRGTKSRFTYSTPQQLRAVPTHAPSPRTMQPVPLQALSPNLLTASSAAANPLDDLVQFKSRSAQAITHPTAGATIGARSNGIEARERVLEAIAPMRRGRPTAMPSSTSTSTTQSTPEPEPASPTKRSGKEKMFSIDMKEGFGAEEDKAWRGFSTSSGVGLGAGVRGHKSGMASLGGGAGAGANVGLGDAWGVSEKEASKETKANGFESDFFGAGAGFGDSFRPSPAPPSRSPVPPTKPPQTQPAQTQAQPITVSRATPSPIPGSRAATKGRDAFEGLGLSTSPATPQTLAEVQLQRERSRSQLGLPGSVGTVGQSQPQQQYLGTGIGSSNTTYRAPSLSPSRPARQDTTSAAAVPKRPDMNMTVEERFPSLEELDRTLLAGSPSQREKERSGPTKIVHATTQPTHAGASITGGASGAGGQHLTAPGPSGRFDGVRSQHVTGIAMRESREPQKSRSRSRSRAGQSMSIPATGGSSTASTAGPATGRDSPLRRPLPRRHRSSISIKPRVVGDSLLSPPLSTPTTATSTASATTTTTTISSSSDEIPTLPPRPATSQRDWLTGASDDEHETPEEPTRRIAAEAAAEQAVLRASPRKRASYIERSPVVIAKPLEAESGSVGMGFGSSSQEAEREAKREEERRQRELAREGEQQERERDREEREREREKERESERQQRREDLEREKARQRERVLQAQREREQAREQQQQERVAPRPVKAFVTRTTTGPSLTGGYALPGLQTQMKAPAVSAPSATSPGGLTENWSPVSPSPPVIKPNLSSSSDEGPEEVGGYVASRGLQQRMAEMGFGNARPEESTAKTRDRSPEKNVPAEAGVGRRRTHSARQSSVHDLAGIWGGTVQQQDTKPVLPTKLADKRRSAIVSSSSMRPIARPVPSSLTQSTLTPSPAPAVTSYTTGRPLPRPPSAQQQRQESSAVASTESQSIPLNTGRSSVQIPRARPQSMFINPVSRTAPLEASVSQHPTSIAEESEEKQRRTARRTSISDMVQRYEAISDTIAKPAPPAKPAGLSVKTLSNDTSSSGVPSPSAAATRFPKLSPDTSPVMLNASLAPPVEAESRPAAGRISPAPRVLSRAPTVISKATEQQFTGASVTGTPVRRAALDAKTTEQNATKTEERPIAVPIARKRTESPEQVRAPSPEKPYQGVSRLIDRWQRMTNDESTTTTNHGPYGGFVPKKSGVANTSLRGR